MLPTDNANGAAGRKPPRAPADAARWPQEARGYAKVRELSTGSFATADLVHVRGAVRQKAVLKTIELTGFDDQKSARLCRAEDAQKRARSVLLLEYANGGNLEQLIHSTYFTKQRRLLEAQICGLFSQIAAAIAHVHERRILHRDLKPANVLFDGPPMTVKVCDFGLCRLFSQNIVRSNTRARTPTTFTSDVWSLDCILCEMACGGSPFVGERSNEFALNLRIRTADFTSLPDGELRTPRLKLLVHLCLQVDFARRPSAAQVQRFADKMAAFFA
ncbi:Serine/threonine-protein kinase Nek6 isoform X2 [Aphelenchoides fujianensis]|nr:Serine/threonine-protein kinase Nek6 isoform X2 [Aphelenchoides fujianensis]